MGDHRKAAKPLQSPYQGSVDFIEGRAFVGEKRSPVKELELREGTVPWKAQRGAWESSGVINSRTGFSVADKVGGVVLNLQRAVTLLGWGWGDSFA